MKKNICVGLALVVGCLTFASQVVVAGEESPAPGEKPITGELMQPPPVITHKVEGYTVTAKKNKCLDCHGKAKYKKKGATKISDTHFIDRTGKVLTNPSSAYYFCNLCHVTQDDVAPMAEQPVDSGPVPAEMK
ncbi:MAG: nitrate reductase cytochrome c-type subunit [Desulfobulbaceae bacterium]|nr:nitrate reductase cytochrome c-type subunit [Desulfobulbaceae bacterium]